MVESIVAFEEKVDATAFVLCQLLGTWTMGNREIVLTESEPENSRFISSTELRGENRCNNPSQTQDSKHASPKVGEKLCDSVVVRQISCNYCINWVERVGSPLKDLLRRHQSGMLPRC